MNKEPEQLTVLITKAESDVLTALRKAPRHNVLYLATTVAAVDWQIEDSDGRPVRGALSRALHKLHHERELAEQIVCPTCGHKK